MESFRPKTPEELKVQVDAAQGKIGEPLLAEEDPEILNMSAAELKEKYPARYQGYLKLLRTMKRSEAIEIEKNAEIIEEVGHSFKLLNGVAEYMQRVESKEDKTLLPRQVETFEKIASFLERGHTEGYVKLPTGVGKTVIFAELLEAFAKKAGSKVLVVGPTKIILNQNRWKLDEFGEIEAGAYYGDEKDLSQPVTVTTYASLRNGIKNGDIDPKQFDVLIFDEAHRAMGEETVDAIDKFSESTVKIGFTATPEFHEEKSVADILPKEIDNMSLPEAIKGNMLAGLRVFIIKTEKDLSTLERIGRDFDEATLEKEVNTPERNKHIVDTFLRFDEVKDKRGVAYCAGVAHARVLAEEFVRQGVKAESIDSSTGWADREKILGRFKHGETQILCNASLLVEGLDEPEAEVCINAAPTLSKIVAEQRGGRVLRRSRVRNDKVGFILEFFDDYGKSQNTPVLFSEIAGAAEIVPEEEEVDEVERKEQKPIVRKEKPSIALKDLKIMVDPEEIMALTNRNRRLRYDRVFEYAPKGWAHPRMLAHDCGVKEPAIKEFVSRLEERYPKWFRRYLTPTDILTTHYHPELVNVVVRHFLPDAADMITAKEFSEKTQIEEQKGEELLDAATEASGIVKKIKIGDTEFYDESQAVKSVLELEKARNEERNKLDAFAEQEYYGEENLSEEEKEKRYWETVDESPSFPEEVEDEVMEKTESQKEVEEERGEEIEHEPYEDDLLIEKDEDGVEPSPTLRKELEKAMATLNAQQKRVLELRYFENKTLDEAGNIMKVTRERVRQAEMAALRKMRHPSRMRLISSEKNFLGSIDLTDANNEAIFASMRDLFRDNSSDILHIFAMSHTPTEFQKFAFSLFREGASIKAALYVGMDMEKAKRLARALPHAFSGVLFGNQKGLQDPITRRGLAKRLNEVWFDLESV